MKKEKGMELFIMKKILLKTTKRDDMIDITTEVQNFIVEKGIEEGIALVYCPHTTAGITINENADPDVKRDMLRRLDEVFPWNHTLDRHMEGNTAAHLKSSTVGSSQQLIIHKGSLVLGRWQGVFFCEFDGPRDRHFFIKLMADKE